MTHVAEPGTWYDMAPGAPERVSSVTGIVGLLMGDSQLLGIFNIEIVEDIIP